MMTKTWNSSTADWHVNSKGDWSPPGDLGSSDDVNGGSVNLGNGDTLDQVEVASTTSSTTYAWDVGNGTWNASSGADWNPPGDGTTPSSTSNVTIGTGGGGTVTLAEDQTIASLSITNGYTLSGKSPNSITTTGNVSVASGGALKISSMNIGGMFTNSGRATLGSLTINSDIVNSGKLVLRTLNLGSSVTLSGGGTVTLGTSASLNGSGVTLTNSDNTIQGTGYIGWNTALALVNQGTINANKSGYGLIVNEGNGGVTNTGKLEATGGGWLALYNTITNTGGTIIASGSGSIVAIAGIVVGGTLKTASGGVMENQGGSDDLKGVTIAAGSTFTTFGGGTTQLDGALIDKGTFLIDGTIYNGTMGSDAFAKLGSAVKLSGGGVVTLKSGSGTAYIEGDGETLTNASGETIQGAGIIGNGSLALTNSGTLDANVNGATLTLNGSSAIANYGVFEATNGGHLDIAGVLLGGAGRLEIGAGSEVELGGATKENSTFLGASSATLEIDNATTTTYSGIINSFVSGDILELGNTSATTATPTLNGSNTTLTIDLSGGGKLRYTLAGNFTGDTFSVTQVGSDSDIAISSQAAFAHAASLLGSRLAGPRRGPGAAGLRGPRLDLALDAHPVRSFFRSARPKPGRADRSTLDGPRVVASEGRESRWQGVAGRGDRRGGAGSARAPSAALQKGNTRQGLRVTGRKPLPRAFAPS